MRPQTFIKGQIMLNNSVIKKLFHFVSMAAAVMLLASCASKPTIESDYDPTVDFSQYKYA